MGLMGVEQYNGRMDVVFFASGSRWSEPREPLYITLDSEHPSHLFQRIQTHFGFSAGQPVHQTDIKHIMVTKQRIVEDFKDGSRGIGDCLELGLETNERMLSDQPDASGSRILGRSVSDLLRGQDN